MSDKYAKEIASIESEISKREKNTQVMKSQKADGYLSDKQREQIEKKNNELIETYRNKINELKTKKGGKYRKTHKNRKHTKKSRKHRK